MFLNWEDKDPFFPLLCQQSFLKIKMLVKDTKYILPKTLSSENTKNSIRWTCTESSLKVNIFQTFYLKDQIDHYHLTYCNIVYVLLYCNIEYRMNFKKSNELLVSCPLNLIYLKTTMVTKGITFVKS